MMPMPQAELSSAELTTAMSSDALSGPDTGRDVSGWLTRRASERGGQAAIIDARGGPVASVTFAELETLVSSYAVGLRQAGFVPGMRVLLMVKPGMDFIALTFGLFRLGAAPVMIDPGMGVSRMLECIRQVNVHGFIGIPLAHLIRVLRPGSFRSVRCIATVGRRWCWGGTTIGRMRNAECGMRNDARHAARGEGLDNKSEKEIRNAGGAMLTDKPRSAGNQALRENPAAILFTSGSTGPAKGVVYEHSMFDAQVRMIQTTYGIEPGEIDLPTFPLFGLFSVAMGMTAVIPEMDASRPAKADPARIVRELQRYRATSTFGSPALWKNVAEYCVSRGIVLSHLRRILIAGAPVPWRTIETLHRVLSPYADVHTPYGATESLPVSSISGDEVVGRGGCPPTMQAAAEGANAECGMRSAERGWQPYRRSAPSDGGTRERTRQGFGICVGRAVAGTAVRIMRISDEPIEVWSDELCVAPGEVGEIVVSGDAVTREYFELPTATAAAKIREDERVWHRIGDLGYIDADQRIWFCGRKAHRVETGDGPMFSVCCEATFLEHAAVSRCALVGIGPRGRQLPVIVVEVRDRRLPRGAARETLIAELRNLALSNARTAAIKRFMFHRSLPVDVRHNAKINREVLAAWAAKRMRN